MLERALSGEHTSYGGLGLSDPRHQYRQRGETLAFLASWIDEAREIVR